MIHNAENCLFIVQCLQIRIHTTTKCMFSLCIPNHPVIEDCNAVYFSDLCITWKKPSEKQVENECYFYILLYIEFVWGGIRL